MVSIKYQPVYPIGEVTHVISGTIWNPGDVKEFDENDKIRIRSNHQTNYIRVVDDLLGSPDFVLADTDLNPNYTCRDCGERTHVEVGLEDNKVVVYEDAGERLCPQCYHNAQADDTAQEDTAHEDDTIK